METLPQALEHLFSPDAPLAYAGMIAAAICALWVAAIASWACWRVATKARARFRPFPGPGANLPRVESAADVRVLRHTVRMTRGAAHMLHNVADIEINQPVRVRPAAGKAFNSFVLGVTDEDVRLAVPLGSALGRDKTAARNIVVSFSRSGDARYEFASRTLRWSARNGEQSVVVRAATPLRRVQQRQGVRVRCGNAIAFAKAAEAGAKRRARLGAAPPLTDRGRLREISLGGATFVGDTALAEESDILIRLETDGRERELLVTGTVVRQKILGGTSAEKLQTSVQFTRLSPEEEQRLGRFIAGLQQRLIRRLTARAASPETRDSRMKTRSEPMLSSV